MQQLEQGQLEQGHLEQGQLEQGQLEQGQLEQRQLATCCAQLLVDGAPESCFTVSLCREHF